jgi:hypothetical protein
MTTLPPLKHGNTTRIDDRANLRHGEDYLLGLMSGFVPAFLKGGPERALRASITHRWQEEAVCASADPEQWFPGKGGSPRLAQAVCAGCPVRRSCLASALLFAEDGIWAGTSPVHRRAAYRAIGNGADVDQILDQLLTRHGRPGTPKRTQRWSGTATDVDTSRGSAAA